MLTIKQIFYKYKSLLKQNNIDTYSLDVDLLLMHCTGLSKTFLYTNPDFLISDTQFFTFESYFKRRLKYEPIAYIIGMCEFMGLNFYLDKNTLIPRPDTEILVESAIKIIKNENLLYGIDIGTGSGAIPISILHYLPNVYMVASDINMGAISIAEKNANINNVANRLSFIHSDLFQNINQKFDFIVSNPPYIKSSIIPTLEPSVKNFEPVLALDGHLDGLFFYRAISKNLHKFLNKGGYVFFEIGHDQAFDVISILKYYNFSNIQLVQDLAGLDRVVFAKYI